MGKASSRYVAKAIPGVGWRIWNNRMKKFWGEVYNQPPEELLHELNHEKRPEELTVLNKQFKK
ncbi:hypothetical protein [Deinococcus ruber]|uniref:Uncharacterized protein n=1 Tax=Deinococcus ruber TaxID=1848197 RepID=A0A918FBN3_9DEIO|nr:hypothetical protein [Deinococcus ruber]GGR24565.1 hypothetical protein GCM10008957_40320 [Deinococcus ruber]